MKITYSSNNGTEVESLEEAKIADVIERATVYIESYKVRDIAKALAAEFSFTEKNTPNETH